LQTQLMGKGAASSKPQAAIALPSSRLATLNANIRDEELIVKRKIQAMKWRLGLAAFTYAIYMIPLCMYILPSVLLFAPAVVAMILTETIWMVIFCGVILFITTVAAMVLKRNTQFAVPFLKTGALLTTVTAFVVTLPMLLLPVSLNSSAYYGGANYLDVSQWFMWQLKDIWLIGRDEAFEVPLLHFSIDFDNLPMGRLALTLSSLAIYIELSTAILHRVVRRLLARWNIVKTEARTLQEWKEALGGGILAIVVGLGVGYILRHSFKEVPTALSPLACAAYGWIVGSLLGTFAGLGYCNVDPSRDFPKNPEGFEARLELGYKLEAFANVNHERTWHQCTIVKHTELDIKLAFKRVGGQTLELQWFPKTSRMLRPEVDVRVQGLSA